MKNTPVRLLFLTTLLVAAASLVPEAGACVTCENLQCKAIATSGAIDCSSGWFFGSYCNLNGDCRAPGGGRQEFLAPRRSSDPEFMSHGRLEPLRRSIRGVFGLRIDETVPQVAWSRAQASSFPS